MTADEITAQIAHVDEMIERCEKVAAKERALKPIRPDMSLPRHLPVSKPVVSAPAPPPSFDPQERFDRFRRERRDYRPRSINAPRITSKHHDYPHICGDYGYGDDVDRAFDECSNAPY